MCKEFNPIDDSLRIHEVDVVVVNDDRQLPTATSTIFITDPNRYSISTRWEPSGLRAPRTFARTRRRRVGLLLGPLGPRFSSYVVLLS